MTVGFDDLNIWRVGEASTLNSSLLPIGHGDEEEEGGGGVGGQALLVQAECSMLLQHSVAAVLHAEIGDEVRALAESSVMGFVYM